MRIILITYLALIEDFYIILCDKNHNSFSDYPFFIFTLLNHILCLLLPFLLTLIFRIILPLEWLLSTFGRSGVVHAKSCFLVLKNSHRKSMEKQKSWNMMWMLNQQLQVNFVSCLSRQLSFLKMDNPSKNSSESKMLRRSRMLSQNISNQYLCIVMHTGMWSSLQTQASVSSIFSV